MFEQYATLIAPMAAGFSALMSVLAFHAFFAASYEKKRLEKRLGGVRTERAALRARHTDADAKARSAEQKLALMKKAVESFNMEGLINSPELRLKLARAGQRGRAAAIRFLFMRVVMPPVLGIGGFLYLHFVAQLEGWDLTRELLAALSAALFGYYLPAILVHNETSKRQQNILKAYPDALDLMVICVESGMSIEQTFNRVSEEIGAQSMPLAEELQLTTAELAYIGDRRQAFENLGQRTGMPQVQAIVSALVQAEKYGTPIGNALRVISGESREERMTRAEQKAAALPAKMTVPMIVFFVPALFIILIGPAIMNMPD
ncbi:MAG: type II secretion system F family protein [Pseudomonadota bacterium]